MPLTKKDLDSIKGLVTEAVSESSAKLEEGIAATSVQLEASIARNTEELAQTIATDVVDKMATKEQLERVGLAVADLRRDTEEIKSHLGTIEDVFAMPAERRFASRKSTRPLRRTA